MKKLMAVVIGFVAAVVVLTVRSKNDQTTAPQFQPVVESPTRSNQTQTHVPEYAAKGRVPAYYTIPPDVTTLTPTLAPELFTGNKRLAYQAAKEIPQTLAQLPCYCHCDKSQNHKSLLSCFESEHGENCGICIGEALMAYNLQKQGVSVSEIRKRIVAAYGDT